MPTYLDDNGNPISGGPTYLDPETGEPISKETGPPGVPRQKPDLKYVPAVDSPTNLVSGAWSGIKNMILHPFQTAASMGQPFVASGMAPGGMYPTQAQAGGGTTGQQSAALNNQVQQQAAQSQGDQGNYAVGHPLETIGNVAGPALLTAGVAKLGGMALSAAKTGLVIPEELKTTAGAYDAAENLRTQAAAQPDPADVQLSSKKVRQSNTEALPDVHTKIGTVLDSKAAEIGADTSSVTGLSNKAAAAGKAWKASAKSKYAIADDIASEATGKPGEFQRLGKAVQETKEKLSDPTIDGVKEQELTDSLARAQAELDAFTELAKSKGINVEKFIKQADKEYSTGLSIEETGRGFKSQETSRGVLRPSDRPLDTPVRDLSVPISKRGHVLQQAFGEEGANGIRQTVAEAADRIARDRATVDAAKARVKATKDAAAKANAELSNLKATSGAAQKRIDAIRGNRKMVLSGAAKAAGAGAALYYGSKALSGHKAARGE